ncbi:MAG: 16S rRNA (adenine(1518)-N(6)/adenine(1519)-N(6))-dimethyltransferase RsmA [Pseudomonadota bacterium]
MTNPPPFTSAPARKALGQHFLFDPDILQRTALAAGPVTGRHVFEVGPGPGGLTRALLDGGAQVTAIEADTRFSDALRSWPEAETEQLHIVQGDARKADYKALHERAETTLPSMIVANLPYNVGTPLFIQWLKAGEWRGPMALMFQKEVALRICAQPNDTHYGRLAVLSQAVAMPHIAFTLPPGAFRPPPKVDSAVAVMLPLDEADQFDDLSALEETTAAAFGQRRKMLRSSLKPLAKRHGLDPVEWIENAGIDPSCRAETVGQNAFRRLARTLAASSG